MAPLYARYVPSKVHDSQKDVKSIVRSPSAKSSLYARYIPPKTVSTDLSRGAIQEQQSPPVASRKRKRDSREGKVAANSKGENENGNGSSAVNAVIGANGIRSKKSSTAVPNESQAPANGIEQSLSAKPERKKKAKKSISATNTLEDVEDDENTKKHSSMISKYQKSLKSAEESRQESGETPLEDVDPPELHDLVPLPVPQQGPRPTPFSSDAALPSWLASPITVPADLSEPFSDLDLTPQSIARLQSKGFAKALPVQSGVLPLLLPTRHQHNGDLCVSAATGSGKTLAYVLPIVQSLGANSFTRLRAVIVVPTRELVEQVRETAELCSAGTNLRIGTALGAQSLDSEQQQLVNVGRRYNPAGYRMLIERMSKQDLTDDEDSDEESQQAHFAEIARSLLPDHVPDYTSKVDILICTPGRLVDHIKSTRGFTLQHVEWFVVDEADRLLDQSFQEWVDTVQGALPTAYNDKSNSCLSSAGSARRIRRHLVRKVVLSATMTRDLGKLASLQLRNPRMVIVQGTEAVDATSDSGPSGLNGRRNDLNLPPTLVETAIPVDDGSLKPLYLLKLLQDILGSSTDVTAPKPTNSRRASSSSGDSSDDSRSNTSDNDASDSDVSSVVSSDTSSQSSIDSDDSQPPTSRHKSASEFLVQDKSVKAPNTPNALIFTSTNESAHRLQHLLTDLAPQLASRTATLTKSSASTTTRRTLRRFAQNRLAILIATDRASRGLDIPSLTNVINYDVPHSVTSYVHRVGRTARAGREGKAWSLVADREAAWFWNAIARGKGGEKIGRGSVEVKRVKINLAELEAGIRERYGEALERLREDVVGGGAE